MIFKALTTRYHQNFKKEVHYSFKKLVVTHGNALVK